MKNDCFRIVFRQLAMANGELVAIYYAQEHFPQFAPAYNDGIDEHS